MHALSCGAVVGVFLAICTFAEGWGGGGGQPLAPFCIVVGALVYEVPPGRWADIQRLGFTPLSPEEHRREMSELMQALGALLMASSTLCTCVPWVSKWRPACRCGLPVAVPRDPVHSPASA
jgi:hypothetical protein